MINQIIPRKVFQVYVHYLKIAYSNKRLVPSLNLLIHKYH
nr:MAG TPA: hypothetical protein [Crassvirales sp.]